MQSLIASAAALSFSFDVGQTFAPGQVTVGGYPRRRGPPPAPTKSRAGVKAARAANVARVRRERGA